MATDGWSEALKIDWKKMKSKVDKEEKDIAVMVDENVVDAKLEVNQINQFKLFLLQSHKNLTNYDDY